MKNFSRLLKSIRIDLKFVIKRLYFKKVLCSWSCSVKSVNGYRLTEYFLLPSFFIKKFAPASVGTRKLEMEGCVECG